MKKILACVISFLLLSGCAYTDMVIKVFNVEKEIIRALGPGFRFNNGRLDVYKDIEVIYGTETEIPWLEFSNSITRIVVHEGVEELCQEMFRGCGKLKEVSLPDSLLKIGFGAFYGCLQLKEIELPKNLKTVGACVFANCPIETLYIPASVTMLDGNFGNNDTLRNISVDRNNKTYADFGCNVIVQLQTMTLVSLCSTSSIPDGVSQIQKHTGSFDFIKNISFPGSLKIINEGSFWSSGIEHLTIPATVEKLEKDCFGNCNFLVSVDFEAAQQPIEISCDAFYGCEHIQQINYNGRPCVFIGE